LLVIAFLLGILLIALMYYFGVIDEIPPKYSWLEVFFRK
jgi:hypothetical protein